jgi:hypothetical protein
MKMLCDWIDRMLKNYREKQRKAFLIRRRAQLQDIAKTTLFCRLPRKYKDKTISNMPMFEHIYETKPLIEALNCYLDSCEVKEQQ